MEKRYVNNEEIAIQAWGAAILNDGSFAYLPHVGGVYAAYVMPISALTRAEVIKEIDAVSADRYAGMPVSTALIARIKEHYGLPVSIPRLG